MREPRMLNFEPPSDDFVIPAHLPGVTSRSLADMVRMIYIYCYRFYTNKPDYGRNKIAEWDGGENRWGTRKANIWPRVAEHILAIEADVFGYVQAQFAAAVGGRFPLPNQLMSAGAEANWAQYRTYIVEQLRRQLTAEERVLTASITPMVHVLQWDQNRALRYCLNSGGMVNLSPLFRFSVGSQHRFPEVQSAFREKAVLQYAFQKSAYDAAWGSFVPEDLQHEALRLRDDMAARSQVSS